MNKENKHIIQTKSLSFSYGNYQALKDITLSVPEGSIFGFLGPNGAGKSTTIKALLGLLHTEPGMVYLFGKELSSNKINILARTGAMVESPSLYEHLNALKNLEYTARLRNLPFNEFNSLIDTVSLTKDAHRKVKQYSTGMKQRLSLAIALLSKPELLILDEPTNGLDPNGIIEMRQLLLRINKEQNCTILLSSHILSEIEKLCTHVAIINRGSITYEGNMQILLEMATENNSIIIHSDNLEKAAELLNCSYKTQIQNDSLLVIIRNKEDISMIIRILVANGINIYSCERRTTGLEASFLQLLNENDTL